MFFKQLKKFTIHLFVGANVASILVMLLVGYSDRLNPVEHPVLSCMGLTFPLLLVVNILFLLFWLLVKPRLVLITVLGLIINYVPVRTYIPINFYGSLPDSTIKVVSYNVKNFELKAEKGAIHPALRYLIDSKADIVCVQEAGYHPPVKNEELRAEYPYCEVMKYGMVHHAIYSKFPIVGKERINYPSKGNGSTAFFVEINGKCVLIVNNHFETSGLSLDDRHEIQEIVKGNTNNDSLHAESKRLIVKLADKAVIRAPQVDAVAEYVHSHSDMPVILCGDFNDSPISYSRHTLAHELTDCYVEAGFGPGWTYNSNGLKVRIDHLLCNDYFVPYKCIIDRKIAASDHYPIVCWLKMQDK